ncbi:MAG: hypothetical protein WEA61_01545 [Anaerolineales bacterium]
MKRSIGGIVLILFAASFFVITMTLLAEEDASAGSTADFCTSNGGSWSGPDDLFGTCSYPANSASAISNCGADHSFAETFNQDETVVGSCTLVAQTQNSSRPGFGGCGNEVRGPLIQPVKLSLCHGKNGTVTFPTGVVS